MEVGGGVQVHVSPFPFLETMDRLRGLITDRGLRLFDIIDHQAAAADVGLELRPTRVLVFGSPTGGTPLMDEWPVLALELPLRIAIWQGEDNHARLAHLAPGALVSQFDLDPAKAAGLDVPAGIVAQLLDGS